MTLYRVTNWKARYENNRTRELKNMAWVPVPNSHDGDGYTALVCRPDGPELFGAWIVILQVASRCGNPAGACGERGTLLRDTQIPHDAASISRMTRFPVKVIEKALSVLSSSECGWLEKVEFQAKPQIPQEGAAIPQEGAAIPQEGDEEQNRTEGKEQNRKTVASLPVLFPESEEFQRTWKDWLEHRKAMKHAIKPHQIPRLHKKLSGLGLSESIRALNDSIANGWLGFFPATNPPDPQRPGSAAQMSNIDILKAAL